MLRRLALITPWPSERTGIADYAFDLAHGLAEKKIEVDVYTTCTEPVPGESGIRIFRLNEFTGRKGYDQVVYQMGNCVAFHAEQLPVLFKHPGIVHLHDPSLHHLIAYFVFRDDTNDYYRLIRKWYGSSVSDWVHQYNETHENKFWESPHVVDVPFVDPVLECATGCIVHSEFARRLVQKRLPNLNVVKHMQAYRHMDWQDSCSDQEILQIGAFGVVTPHKKIDAILEAVRRCNADGKKVHFHVGGGMDEASQGLPDRARSLGIESDVTFYGRMAEDEFLSCMKRMDVCISLRYPTMGETSAIVSRTMQLGLPTIVNDVGWYSELPECVFKLPVEPDAMVEELANQLCLISDDRRQLEKWKSTCLQQARSTCSFDQVVGDYVESLTCLGSHLKIA